MWNDKDDEKCYVIQHKESKLYATCIKRRLYGMKCWMDVHNPTIKGVKKQLDFLEKEYPSLTKEINDAEIWMQDSINVYEKYVKDFEFIEVNLLKSISQNKA